MTRLETVFEWCNDIAAMRRFYTDLLGLDETFFSADHGWLRHRMGDFETAFMVSPEPIPVIDTWSVTPTLGEGVSYLASWLLEVEPDIYDAIFDRMQQAGIPMVQGPENPSVRNFFVMDPMGKTIEVYTKV
jgi:catechol 2,3-dioxygenase-like lactoylglutathione lyase family enzyme